MKRKESMIIRSFLPVGQGAFYRESFQFPGMNRKINVIYDCGSLPDFSIVKERIREDFDPKEIVDAVFISHFDDDHCNGLPYLLNYCQVKNLFLPLITKDEKTLCQLAGLSQYGKKSIVYSFRNFLRRIVPNTRVFWVKPEDETEENAFSGFDSTNVSSGENVSRFIFDERSPAVDWKYVPFNFESKTRSKQFEKAICVGLNVGKMPDDILSNYNQYADAVKAAFKKVQGTVNSNSMVLFSGIEDQKCKQHPLNYSGANRLFRFEHRVNGCLYTGDYEASGKRKWEHLKNAFANYWDYIGCFQIPHHGAQNGYNPDMAKLDVYNVICAGFDNKYGHPHSKVLKDLLCHHCNVQLVTEARGSQVDFLINCN